MKKIIVGMSAVIIAAGCATSPTGRRQLQLMPEDQMSAMGTEAFTQLKQESKISNDARINGMVRCVADSIVAAIPPDLAKKAGVPNDKWEVVVFERDDANAFALPGGKIGVHTGMLKIAKTPDQLAAVMGHEVSHVLAEHGNERVSQSIATESGLALAAALAASSDPAKQERRQMLMGLIGLGAQVGILLPFSRTQESESDKLGLDIMARAGFNPQEAVQLWKNMDAAGGGQPPEFLSTHPSHGTRISDLNARMGAATALYEEAQRGGKKPSCANPAVASIQ